MNYLKSFVIVVVFGIYTFPQIKTEYLYEFRNFLDGSEFTISSNGIIFISSLSKNEIISFDTLGNKLKNVGGFGWGNGLFDQPVDIFANPLAVFVADKNNHRIQQFDRDLNFIGSFSTRDKENYEFSFGFPLSIAISNQGDLFVLDGENDRIIKFDMFGNYITNFAGIREGKFKLKNPTSIAVDPRGRILVTDQNLLRIYDNYGNHLSEIMFDEPLKNVNTVFNNCLIISQKHIYKLLMNNSDVQISIVDINDIDVSMIKSAFVFNNKLYVLQSNKVLIYKID